MSGEELRKFRLQRGLTQQKLAILLGVKRITITRSERRNPGRLVCSLLERAIANDKL